MHDHEHITVDQWVSYIASEKLRSDDQYEEFLRTVASQRLDAVTTISGHS